VDIRNGIVFIMSYKHVFKMNLLIPLGSEPHLNDKNAVFKTRGQSFTIKKGPD